jgi:hypothetical protein
MEFRAAFFYCDQLLTQRFTWRGCTQDPKWEIKIYYNHSEAHETLAA